MNNSIRPLRKLLLILVICLHALLLPPAASVHGFVATDVARLKDDPPRVAAPKFYAVPSKAYSGNPVIDALLSGFQWEEPVVTYSFYSDAAFGGDYYGSEAVSEVSETVKSNFRQIFKWLSNVVNVEFQEVAESAPDGYGIIRIMLSDGPTYAYSYFPSSFFPFGLAGDIHLNHSYQHALDLNGWETPPGYHGHAMLIHELGHALGLKHPFEGDAILPPEQDNQSHTVMTYAFSAYSPGTFMTYDVVALQYLYGSSPYQSGRTHYVVAPSIDRYRVGETVLFDSASNFKQSIWDPEGVDTLDLSLLAYDLDGYRVDMRPGGWLSQNSGYDGATFSCGIALCENSSLENVLSSSSDDTIYFNEQPNRVGGFAPGRYTGRDRIEGADAQDAIDLTRFEKTTVIQNRDEDDLVLDLSGYGTVRIVGYFTGNTPRLLFPVSLAPIYPLLFD
jgi:serralysin